MTDLPHSGPHESGEAIQRRELEHLVALRTAELATAKEAAEAALAAKSAFLARMSHEIRTPMNTIIGLNHIMLRDVTDPTTRGRIEKVLGAALQLLGLIDDILDLSRIEAGQVALTPVDFAPRQLVEGVAGMIGSELAAKGIRLEVDIADDVPEYLRGDANRLRQVLLNFATNAAKFTERGSVRFSVGLAHRSTDVATIRFTVSDTGIGVSEALRSRLFEPFEQGEGGIARRYGGTGLGLAICERLARLMSGKVGVESELGNGSAFWLEAPFKPGAEVPPPVARARPTRTAAPESGVAPGHRVLLVDDNALNLEVAESLLRMEGYDVEPASDGLDAVERARENSYGAILIDVQMPRLDGLEATKLIRRMARHVATPIIAMTANVFEEDRQVCIDAGMDDVVAKPVDPEHLRKVLARWMPAALTGPAGASARHDEPAGIAAPAPADVAGMREQLRQLQRMVAADDIVARDFFRTLPSEAAGSRHAELGRLLDRFDYEQAGALIVSLLDRPRSPD